MYPMQNKTQEERKAIAAKAVATRRARIAAEEAERKDAIKYAGGLRQEIAELEERLLSLKRMETMNAVSASITGKSLLREDEIAKSALPWARSSGVYFLLDGDSIVYVGQAVNVYSRIDCHKDKKFDRYAFVPCPVEVLDKLESLYIHLLRPVLNGNQCNNAKYAPIPLDVLLGMA